MRRHLRTVSRNGHSHAVSMCAWPTATIRCALRRAGRASAGREHAPAAARRCRRRRSGRAGRTPWPAWRSTRWRRASVSGSAVTRPRSTSTSSSSSKTSSSRRPRSARRSVYSGASPAVAKRAERRRAGTPGTPGSTPPRPAASSGPAGASGSGTPVRRGWTPCSGTPSCHTSPSAWKPAESRVEAEIDHRLELRPDPCRRHVGPEVGTTSCPTDGSSADRR